MVASKFSEDIPIIDISYLSNNYEKNQASIEIGKACREIGFFYVTNHGISNSHIQSVFDEAKKFFDSSLENKNKILEKNYNFYSGYVPFYGEKTKDKLDFHEAFDMIRETSPLEESVINGYPAKGPNQWPTWMKSFKGIMMENWNIMENLGKSLTKGIFISLDLEEKLMREYMRDPVAMQRIIYYPKTENEEQGIGAHKDYGFATIVAQDREGLEIKNKEDKWIKVKQIENSFVVNIGYMVENWTNGIYSATEHRVLTSKEDRTSVIFFIGPSAEINISPLESCCSINNPPKFKPYNYGEYFKRKMKESYGK